MRIGLGFDAHRLGAGRPFILGGVRIEHETGALGHSDADVLAHAVADAILGAAGMGDLGARFPDTDARWKDADSLQLLASCGAIVRDAGFAIANIDATVVVQQPRIAPHIVAIRAGISGALQLAENKVSVKAKTSEGMGYTGDGSGIAAYAVALLEEQ